jgi:hypothetical protein
MSQRLTKNSPQRQRVIGHVAGQALYVLRGASPEDDGGDEDGGDTGSGEAGSGSEEDSGSEGSDEGKVSDDALAKLEARMKAADRRASEAERKLREREEADLTEAQKKDKELGELQTFRETAQKEITSLRTQVAFLSVNDVAWQDPDIALGQVDLTGLIDEDGNVDKKSLKDAVAKLAKDKPFLVKAATVNEGGDAKEKQGSSGSGVGSSSKQSKNGALSEEELKKRYPALYV